MVNLFKTAQKEYTRKIQREYRDRKLKESRTIKQKIFINHQIITNDDYLGRVL